MMNKWPKYSHMKRYRLLDCNKEKLNTIGYHFAKSYCDEGETLYMFKFPVYKYSDYCTLEARLLTILETGETRLDVYDVSTHGVYAPWYIKDAAHEPIIQKINETISKTFQKLHIKEIGNYES